MNNSCVGKMAPVGIDRDEYLLLFALLFTNSGVFFAKSKDNMYRVSQKFCYSEWYLNCFIGSTFLMNHKK
jgi:hypothetical protein